MANSGAIAEGKIALILAKACTIKLTATTIGKAIYFDDVGFKMSV
jgi:hypothetical protein